MINYKDITFNEVSIIKELWERNRKYHEKISKDFGFLYSDIIFEDRISGFKSFNEDNIKITIAVDDKDSLVIGYCISTYEYDKGEIQTIHVLEECRGEGVGKYLINLHISWLKLKGCNSIVLSVDCNNSNTIEFYKSLGFGQNVIEMRLK